MNTAGTLITAMLTLAGLISAGLCLLYARNEQSVLRYLCMTVSAFLTEYLVASGLLFMLDRFSIHRTLILTALVNILLFVVFTLLARKKGLQKTILNWDLRKEAIPVLLIAAGIILSWTNFSFFGMGQDQGVYQTKAIELICGNNGREYVLEEYEKLETDEQRESFLHSASIWLVGLYNADSDEDVSVPEQAESEFRNSWTFHGNPAFCTVLALFGVLFGLENMTRLQAVLYILGTLMIWYTAGNLKLKKLTGCFMALLYLLSPEVVWLSKSTLTEPFLGLIAALFFCLLTNDERPDWRWMSSLMVVAFAFLHITIFVMFPMFVMLYLLLYLYGKEKQYLRAMTIASAGYMAGMGMMILLNPHYAHINTNMLLIGPITKENVFWVLEGVGLFFLVLSLLLRKIKKGTEAFRSFLGSAGFAWLIRIVLAGLLAWGIFAALKGSGGSLKEAVTRSGLYNMAWMTGLISLPVILISLLWNPRPVLKNELYAGITFTFLYAVLFRVCVLQSDIQYCYYYGRYLAPLIPFVCVMAGILFDRFSTGKIAVGLVAGSLAVLPFDAVLQRSKDDSKCSYDLVQRIAETVKSGGKDTAVVFSAANPSYMMYIPVREMTEADCYFEESDLFGQIRWLSEKYSNVMYLGYNQFLNEKVLPYSETLLRVREPVSDDDNVSGRIPLIPFPLRITEAVDTYTLISFLPTRSWSPLDLHTVNGTKTDYSIILPPEALQYGPYVTLEEGRYEVTIQGENLTAAEIRVSAEKGKKLLPFSEPARSGDHITFTLTLEEPAEDVEFVTINHSGGNIAVNGIRLRKDLVLPEKNEGQ